MVALSLAVASSVASCSQPDPHPYDNANAVAQQRDLKNAGHVLYTGTYGTGGFSSDKPTLVYVFDGPTARATVEAKMRSLGYIEPTLSGDWWEPSPQSPVVVSITDLPAGTTYAQADHKSGTVERDAVEVSLHDLGIRATST